MPETLATMDERKINFLAELRQLGDWSPIDARNKCEVSTVTMEDWLRRDNHFREQYYAIKSAWIGQVTERAVKSIASTMFERGKEWLLVQWLKVHDPDWRNAARAQTNIFTQLNLVSQVRDGSKPLLVKDEVTKIRSGDALSLQGADRAAMMGAMTTERNQAR